MIKGIGTAIAVLLAIVGVVPASAAEPQPARAVRELYHFFTADDYPLEAIRRHSEGTTGFRLTIDAQGAVSGCTVESSSGDADLDRVTCEILRSRAHYYPARDAGGRAVGGSDTGRVTWRLPQQQEPVPLPLETADIEGMVRMNGQQLACRTTRNGRTDGPTVSQMCELLVGVEGGDILRRSVAGTEFSAILSIRPGDAGAAPAAGDALLYRTAAALTVRPDGSVSSCAPMGEPARPPAGFVRLPDPCALFPVGMRPYFAAEPARTQPRSVRLYLRYYLRPRQQLAAASSVPAQRARANLNSYFSADDYPETAARRGIEGTTRFRLEISPDGRVTNCTVAQSSGDPALDSATCSVLLSRAEYAPARDANGRPVAGTDEGRVTWRLPPPEEAEAEVPFANVRAPVRIDLTVGFDAAHRQTCAVLVNGEAGGKEGQTLCDFVTAAGDEMGGEDVPANMALTIGVAIGLEDAMPPAVALDRGVLMMDATARLTVSPDGRVARCEVTETNYHQDISGQGQAFDLCTFPALSGQVFAPAPEGARERVGRIRVEMHVRAGVPQNT